MSVHIYRIEVLWTTHLLQTKWAVINLMPNKSTTEITTGQSIIHQLGWKNKKVWTHQQLQPTPSPSLTINLLRSHIFRSCMLASSQVLQKNPGRCHWNLTIAFQQSTFASEALMITRSSFPVMSIVAQLWMPVTSVSINGSSPIIQRSSPNTFSSMTSDDLFNQSNLSVQLKI